MPSMRLITSSRRSAVASSARSFDFCKTGASLRVGDYTARLILPSVGHCIYCGTSKGKLTDEHPIPAGWGSRIELPKASCEVCQRIINEEFEQHCLRELFGILRKRYGLKSHRKRPEHRPSVTVTDDKGQLRKIQPPADQAPLMIALPLFSGPFQLAGRANVPPFDLTMWLGFKPDSVHAASFAQDMDWIGAPVLHVGKFLRFLAKMAHGFAVATIGEEAFEPFLQPLILGRDPDFTRYIGAYPGERPPVKSDQFFTIGHVARNDDPAERIVVVEIFLFANIGAPKYLVAVGRSLNDPWRYRPEIDEIWGR